MSSFDPRGTLFSLTIGGISSYSVQRNNESSEGNVIDNTTSTDQMAMHRELIRTAWEPPLFCRRRSRINIPTSSAFDSYFPLELNNTQYLGLILHVIHDIILIFHDKLLCHTLRQHQISSGSRSNDISLFFDMLFASHRFVDVSIYESLLKFAHFHNVKCQDNETTSSLLSAIKVLANAVKFYQSFGSQHDISNLNESGRIDVDFLGSIINAANVFIQSLNIYASMNRSSDSNDHKHIFNIALPHALNELKEMKVQIDLHSKFKEHRMKVIGWWWTKTSVSDDVAANTPEDFRVFLHSVSEMNQKLDELLNAKSFCTMLLYQRLICMAADLYLLMHNATDVVDLVESRRLRNLAIFVEETVDERARSFLDGVHELLEQSRSVCDDLHKYRVIASDRHDFATAQDLKTRAADTAVKIRRIQQALTNISILDDERISSRLTINSGDRSSSNFIDADFIFHYNAKLDNLSIASLVIRAASHAILGAIKSWPGLTTLNTIAAQTTVTSRRASFSKSKSVAGSSTVSFRPQISELESDGARSTSISPQRNKGKTSGELHMSHLNSLKVFDNNPITSLKVANQLVLSMQQLLETSAVAHTQLIQRLGGLCIDLQTLSSINLRAGAVAEAQRLSEIGKAVQHSLDVDIHDVDVYCGRSTKRIDLIDCLLDECRQICNHLKGLNTSDGIQNDFTLLSAVNKMVKQLAIVIEQVSRTKRVFTLFDRVDGVEDFEERVALSGTHFVTSDFLLQIICGPEQQSLISLGIIGCASVVLNDMRAHWPDVHAFVAMIDRNLNEGPLSEYNFTATPNTGEIRSTSSIDFTNASSLRKLGFSPEVLRTAGFTDVDILGAGFSFVSLKTAGFSAMDLRASGVASSALCAGGLEIELQHATLKEFFQKTAGLHWNRIDGWDNSGSELLSADAYGLKFDSNKRLSRLILCRNNLKGLIPSNLGSLVTLTQLLLNGNSLTGMIPDSIALLTNLTSLMLNDNALQGSIPSTFKSLQNLVILRLDNNKLAGGIPQSFGDLSKLRRLTLSHNLLEGKIPSRMGGMLSLQELILNHNKFGGLIPDTLGGLLALTTLHLQNNQFQGVIPQSFAALTNLTSLNIQNNGSLSVDRIQLQRMLPRCHKSV